MVRFFFVVVIFFINILSLLAFDNYASGAGSASMGTSSVMMPNIWSAQNNQAALAFYNKFSLGIHHENRFIVPEYGFQAVHLSVPVNFGTFAATYTYFGYKLFNDKKFGIAYSRKLFEKLAVGVQMDYIHTYIFNYGKDSKICAEIGLFSEPVENLMIGIHGFNVLNTTNRDENFDPLPVIIRMGLGYRFGDKLIITAETEKDVEKSPVYKGGMEYNALHGLYIMTGFSSNPGQYTFGLGFVYQRIRGDLGFMSHPELDFTPHFSLSYEFN